jgi:hypothetical protein
VRESDYGEMLNRLEREGRFKGGQRVPFLDDGFPQAATSLRLMMFMAAMSVIPSGVSNSMMLASEDESPFEERDGWMDG